MDWELIFWVTSPIVAILSIFVYGYLQDKKYLDKKKNWQEHADDFNKDLWEEDW